MDLNGFIKSYSLHENNEFFEMETDYEVIIIRKDNGNLRSSEQHLLRFVDSEVGEALVERFDIPIKDLDAVHFLPTHIENLIFDYFDREIIDPMIYEYLGIEKKAEEKFIKKKIQNNLRKNKGTSFFRIHNSSKEDILEVAKMLKKELRSLEDHHIAFGSIPEGYGLLEFQSKEKTKNPTSNHIDFWKLDNSKCNIGFKQVADCFSLVI